MKKLMLALGSLGALASKSYCPDCGEQVGSNGCCSDCGYGEEDDMESEDDGPNMQTMLDLRDALQSAIKLIDRMIVNGSSESKDDSMPPVNQTTTWVRQGSQAAKS
jgi:hypothetical protein